MTHKEIEDTLEAMIDGQGVVAVLTALVNICHGKADHVATNWQDKPLARAWTKGAKRIEKALVGDWPL